MSEPAGRTKGIVIPVRQSPYPVSAKETRSCEEEDAEERRRGGREVEEEESEESRF